MKRISILWLGTLGIAFFAGYQLKTISYSALSDTQHFNGASNSQPAVVRNSTDSIISEAKTTLPSSSYSGATTGKQADLVVMTDVDTLVTEVKGLMGAKGFGSNFKSIAKAYTLIKQLNESELSSILQTYFANTDEVMTSNAMVLFLSEYAEHNPSAAIAFVTDNVNAPMSKTVAMMSVLSAWAEQDPILALDWYQSESGKSAHKNMFNGFSSGLTVIFAGLADENIDLAIDKLGSLKPNEMKTATMGIASTVSTASEFTELMDKIKTFDNANLQSSIVMAWGTKNPQGLANWLDNNYSGEDTTRLRDEAMQVWMMSSPEDGAEWYMQGGSPSEKQEKLNKVVSSWSIMSAASALEWLKNRNLSNNQSAIARLLSRVAHTNQELVISNIQLLDDPEQKTNILHSIYRNKLRATPDEANEFLNASPYKQEILEKEERMRQAREKYKKRNTQ